MMMATDSIDTGDVDGMATDGIDTGDVDDDGY